MRHRANLDILRTFAVSAVVVDHLLHMLPDQPGQATSSLAYFTAHLGHAGVIAFFVHTSLVLMYSLERLHKVEDRVALRFYIRRFFRIYPLAICVILLVLALHIPTEPYSPWWSPGPLIVAANLLLVQNLVTGHSVVGPLWSLPYEVEMYVVLPFLFLLARKLKAPLYISSLIALFCLIGVALFSTTGHLGLFAYIPCFLSGILCYTLRNRVRPFLSAALWPIFLLVAIAAYCFANQGPFSSFWSGWIFSLILALAINAFHDSRVEVVNLAAARIALYSYGIYLLHVPALYLVFVKWHIANLRLGEIVFLAIVLIASAVAFHAIESPFIEIGRRFSSFGLRRELPSEPGSIAPAP